MSDPLKVHVRGPLVSLVIGFRGSLAASGYAPNTVSQQLQLIAHLSVWMLVNGLGTHDLSPSTIEAFFRHRRSTHRHLRTPRALVPFVAFLDGEGLDRTVDPATPLSVAEGILHRFGHYLSAERALRATTVENYLNQARPFVEWRFGLVGEDLSTLTANEITGFLQFRGVDESVGSIRVAATALRAFLCWTYLVQITPESLAGAIGPVAYSSYAGLPKALTTQQLQAVSGQAAVAVLAPLRNLALVSVFSRMGLRSRETAELRLDDIDWRAGTVFIAGKGGQTDVMPLPADVGAALARYLKDERPSSQAREVFLQARAPHAPLGRSGVSMVVTCLGARAGIVPRIGAHRLRHTAATTVLAAGGSLTEAAQLLRHSSPVTTVIYAKVNLVALRTLIRPWPGSPSAASNTLTDTGPLS